MGYTHYWTQLRDFTPKEWKQVCKDMEALLNDVQTVQRIPLADGSGEPGSVPTVNSNKIWFNGLGDEAHETFCLGRIRPLKRDWQPSAGWDFCKTAMKPYDLAVTAALCYLATVTKTHDVTSDGDKDDWTGGLEEARRVWPQHAAILAIPTSVENRD